MKPPKKGSLFEMVEFLLKIKVGTDHQMREDLEQQEQLQNLKAFWKENGKWITSSLLILFVNGSHKRMEIVE